MPPYIVLLARVRLNTCSALQFRKWQPRVGSGSCGIDSLFFLAAWCKRCLNWVLVAIVSVCVYVHGRSHWGIWGSGPPQNLDGPPTFYVAFWWIEYDCVIECTTITHSLSLYDAGAFHISVSINSDLTSLAKAAVSGDEAALDLLSWNTGKVKMSFGPQESLCFFVGGINGECQRIFCQIFKSW